METYVELDVSQKSTAVCAIDGDGNSVWRGTVASHPQAIDNIIRQQAPDVRRVAMETGPLSVWFYHGLLLKGAGHISNGVLFALLPLSASRFKNR
ncbi:hypothetical protein PHO31112_04987 [Pandoraea horticolens]|uniref:Transposase n=1 Tax=Pandoraea horticolens TaxID=2508298 RepID=A0A5E4Z276_9BURK|nr:hypothetical protein PHO31112_04987 [Pandoraea horticolens]